MCYERGLATVRLEETDRVAQVEFLSHTGFVSKVSGIDPLKQPDEALRRTYDALDLDMVWATWDPLHPWEILRRSGGSFETRADSWSAAYPTTWRTVFNVSSVEDMLEFNPLEEWRIPSRGELVEFFRREHSAKQGFYRSQLVPGGKYQTCFMWLIMMFGLEWTVKAAYRDPKRFEKLLERFHRISKLEFEAWAETDIKVFISHDDICSTRGPFFPPEWLRRHVFPRYEKLWSILKSKGIRVLFCSDGDVTPIVDDIARAGADGFILEECSDLSCIVEKHGSKKIIVGGVDIGVLTYGSVEDVVNEVKRCLRIAGECPGYFINVSGSIPDNVPIENLEAYFEACRKYGRRPVELT
ncbi:MAG: uroporphyrinogen decarboxylase family protein [Thermoproteota archaeon]